jgi:hypothetical protein
MSEAEKDAEISSLKNLYEEEKQASLLRRERLLSILVGGSEEGDFGIRAVNSKSSVAQGGTATRAEFVKCAFSQ